MKRPGWTSRRVDQDDESIEVFVAPDGRWYKRARKGDVVDLELPMGKGLRPFPLTNIDHWRPVEAPA